MIGQRGVLRIARQSLLRRWYAYWVEKGGERRGRENLCHFVRVLLFWAPLRWFFFAKTKKVVAPWSVTLAAVLTTLTILYPIKVVLTIVGVLAAIAILAILFFTFIGIEKLNDRYKIGNTMEDFLEKEVVGRLPVWFFLVSGIIMLAFRFFPIGTLLVIIATFIAATIIVMVFLVCCFFEVVRDKLEHARIAGSSLNDKLVSSQEVHLAKPSAARQSLLVAVEYIKAKKAKICPFIEFVDA